MGELGGENAHETGQYHQIRRMRVDQGGESLVIAGPIGKCAVAEHRGGDAGLGGTLQTKGIVAIGNYRDDVGLSAVQRINEGLKVAA